MGRITCLTEEQQKWAYRKWCEGYTHEEIAEALYVHKNTVGYCLRGMDKVKPALKYVAGQSETVEIKIEKEAALLLHTAVCRCEIADSSRNFLSIDEAFALSEFSDVLGEKL